LLTLFKQKHESQKISSFAAAFVWFAVMGAVLVISTVHYGGAIWLDFMYYLSFVKLTVSFIKYLPQVTKKTFNIVFFKYLFLLSFG
jgi:cystinosin